MVLTGKKIPLKEKDQPEQQWDNQANPEKAGDERDIEQLKRQKKDVEQKNKNITDKDPNDN
jgi:hypothetical protein